MTDLSDDSFEERVMELIHRSLDLSSDQFDTVKSLIMIKTKMIQEDKSSKEEVYSRNLSLLVKNSPRKYSPKKPSSKFSPRKFSPNRFNKYSPNYKRNIYNKQKRDTQSAMNDQSFINLLKMQNLKFEKSLETLNRKLNNMAKGMGLNFESFNLSWIRKFLELKYPNIGSKLKLQHKVSDSSCTVIDKSNEFVIDIYCPDPLIIAQHTSFLKHYETDKVHKLLRMNDFLMHEKDDDHADSKPPRKNAELFFFCFEVDHRILDSIMEFCNKEGINLIMKASIQDDLEDDFEDDQCDY